MGGCFLPRTARAGLLVDDESVGPGCVPACSQHSPIPWHAAHEPATVVGAVVPAEYPQGNQVLLKKASQVGHRFSPSLRWGGLQVPPLLPGSAHTDLASDPHASWWDPYSRTPSFRVSFPPVGKPDGYRSPSFYRVESPRWRKAFSSDPRMDPSLNGLSLGCPRVPHLGAPPLFPNSVCLPQVAGGGVPSLQRCQ